MGAFENNNVITIKQDVCDKKTFDKVIEKLPELDIIVDDALHQAKVQYQNFTFPKLKSGGYYAIEDMVDVDFFHSLYKNVINAVVHPNACNKKTTDYSIGCQIKQIHLFQNIILF